MTTTAQTDWTTTLRFQRERDDYGRSVTRLMRGHDTLGVVVAIPRRTRDLLGYSHFVNNRMLPQDAPGKITEHQSLRAAKAYLQAIHGQAAYTI